MHRLWSGRTECCALEIHGESDCDNVCLRTDVDGMAAFPGGCPYVVCQAAVGSFVAGWGVWRVWLRIMACRVRMRRWARARTAWL